jgi:SRSO17 transposase
MRSSLPDGCCGHGSKGERYHDWAWIHLDERRRLLVRRSISDPSELAYYRCHATEPVTLAELVRVAGSRWSIEECFQATKHEVGLDHYPVRQRLAWYRHITLAMVAPATWPSPPPDRPQIPTQARARASASSPHRPMACGQPNDTPA